MAAKDILSIGLDELKVNLFGLMKDLVKQFWKKEDTQFLKQLAEDIAREAWLSRKSDDPEEHRQNLLHLAATLRGEILRKELQIKAGRKQIFVDVLTMVIKTVASVFAQAAKVG